MYRGFNLSVEPIDDKYLAKGQEQFRSFKNVVSKYLSKLISPTGVLNGTLMQNEWFPSVNAEIFISHSHNDENEAIKLAGWLKDRFGLNCFVDSCIWGNAGDLLKMIDDQFCHNSDTQTYSYQKRNLSTSHVHMMLSTALAKMINKTECLIFLNTPNSVSAKSIIDTTTSPWIYMELAIGQLLKKPLDLHRKDLIKAFSESEIEQRTLKIEYDLDLNKFTELNRNDLKFWANKWQTKEIQRNTNALDLLYKLHPLENSNFLHS